MLRATLAASRSITFYVVALVALMMLFVFGLIAFSTASDFKRTRSAAADRVQADAREAAALLSRGVDIAKSTLVSQAALPGYAAVFDDPSRCTVTSNGAGVFTKGAFHVIRSDGSIACTSLRAAGGLEGRGYAGSEWLVNLDNAEEPVVAGPLLDPVTRARSLIIAAPIGEVPGAVLLSLDLNAVIPGLLAETEHRVPPPSFVVLSPDRASELARATTTGAQGVSSPFTRAIPKGSSLTDVDGVERIFAENSVPGLGWHVLAGVARSDAYARAWDAFRERLAMAGIILIVFVAAGWLINRRITLPIRDLAGALEDASETAEGQTVPERGPSELRKLGMRVNRLLRQNASDRSGLREVLAPDRRVGGRRELDRMKSAFLLTISHEVRTPLAIVSGYAEVLEEQVRSLNTQEIIDHSRRIRGAAKRLEGLLLDILDIERMSRGVLEASRHPVHLRGLVERMLEFTEPSGKLSLDISKGLVINVDPGLMERIVENLVRNAMKHTPSGTPIWIRARQQGAELRLTVEDAGPGVPDDMKKEIFEPFRQGDAKTNAPGTGVGLALVEHFARLHGGRAWVEDRAGGGSSFHVTFADTKVAPAQRLAKSA